MLRSFALLPKRRRDRLAALAAFVGAAVAGASIEARATPPCPIGETLILSVSKVSVDGKDKTPPTDTFFFQSGNAPEVVPFVATVYDPDTGKSRGVELKRAP
jgi:hypothetical protein